MTEALKDLESRLKLRKPTWGNRNVTRSFHYKRNRYIITVPKRMRTNERQGTEMADPGPKETRWVILSSIELEQKALCGHSSVHICT